MGWQSNPAAVRVRDLRGYRGWCTRDDADRVQRRVLWVNAHAEFAQFRPIEATLQALGTADPALRLWSILRPGISSIFLGKCEAGQPQRFRCG